MDFQKLYPNRDLKPFPNFSRPQICGVFSVDSERHYHNTMENLKYLKIPREINFNLNLGDDKYAEKLEDVDEKIKHLLSFIIQNRDKVINSSRVNADYVCYRGLLKTIMCTPYERNEPWICLATKYQGTIYLCAQETEKKKIEKREKTERDKMFMRYGHKFENYILSNHPSVNPYGLDKPVIESEEFCVMFNAKIGDNSILFGAEIDGVFSNEEIKSLNQLRKIPLVEVKVKRQESNERQVQNFYRHKARNFWCQSFLVGIENLYVGIRDDDGIVNEVVPMSLKDLCDVSKKNNYWHGTVCVNFLNNFLNKVKNDMKRVGSEPFVVFKYEWDVRNDNCISCQYINDEKMCFITQEFLQFMKNPL